MKIGIVSPYAMTTLGGVQEHILNQKFFLEKKGHEVKVICPYKNKHEKAPKDFILIGQAQEIKMGGTCASITLGLNYGPQAQKIMDEEKFDVMHFHQPNVPTLSWFFIGLSNCLNIATLHRADDFTLKEETVYFVLKLLAVFLNSRTNGRIAVSEYAKKHNSKHLPGQYTVIPNGVDTERFSPNGRKIEKFNDGKINILFVGRLEERKGVLYLLRAFKKIQGCRLIVAGDGPQRKILENFVRKNMIEDVIFTGPLQKEDLPSYYQTADIFCAPSTRGESFGIVLLEAMASGLPLVVFNNPGYKEMLKNYPNKNLLAPVKNVKKLKVALKTLIENKKLRKDLGTWGRETSLDYSWPKITEKILAFYKEKLEEKSKNNMPRKQEPPPFIKDLEKYLKSISGNIFPQAQKEE